MKILHVAPSIERAYGGPTQSLAGYIAASKSAGMIIDVAAPSAAIHEMTALKDAGARAIETFTGYGSGGTATSPALVRWVRENARSYDVVHVHGLFNFISTFGARAAIKTGAPVLIRPFGTLSRYTFGHRRSTLKRVWFNRLERPNLVGSAGIHFTTSTERDEAAWHELALSGKAHIVPPPFIAGESVERPAEAPNRPTVLFLGRFHPVKNIELLLKAWDRVEREMPDARLEIAGDGPKAYVEEIQRRSAGRAVFSGFLSGLAKASALTAASLLVLPSLHENFGMVVIEAISAGVPVVVSEHVQLRDFVAGNDLGIVASDSADSLAAAIVAALRDTALRDRVRLRGRELVDRNYSPTVIGKKLETMYLSVLSN
jgi:glycosyltransferase involved in cell wall biosynthesis